MRLRQLRRSAAFDKYGECLAIWERVTYDGKQYLESFTEVPEQIEATRAGKIDADNC